MQNVGWISLLRLIPTAQHSNLMVTTSTGAEIVLQSVVRMDPDYVVLRGRLSGTTEGGGYFFVPYDQIVFLGFQKHILESEIRKMLGEPGTNCEVVVPPPTEAAQLPISPLAAVPGPLPVEAALSGGINGIDGPEVRSMGAAKAVLLERMRARRSGQDGQPPPRP